MFRIEDPAAINLWLDENGLEACEGDQLIVKRTMTVAGQNRQFVNNATATLATLKELGRQLVDLHGPHDHQSLLSRERQLELLDAFGRHRGQLDLFKARYTRWREAEREFREFADAEQSGEAALELLRHQVKEIEAAGLRPGEDEDVLRRFTLASNGARLAELGGSALRASRRR